MDEKKLSREEKAIVLDFLPNGYPFDKTPIHRKTAIAQAIGANNFTLLELVPRKGVFLQPLEEVYIGPGRRDKIHHINGKLTFHKLTQTAQQEVEAIIKNMIAKNEKNFVDIINKAGPLSIRMHSLELLPGLGKKHVRKLLDERRIEDFKSFEDIKKRAKLASSLENILYKRLMIELKGDDKHKFFLD